jgi:hypothetical protein
MGEMTLRLLLELDRHRKRVFVVDDRKIDRRQKTALGLVPRG